MLTPTPALLPIFRSQQQAELLALILGDPSAEHSLAEFTERTGIPYASVHREVERAQAAGLVTSRLVGRTRLIRSDPSSPYFAGLSDVLVKAFGVPWVLGQTLAGVGGIDTGSGGRAANSSPTVSTTACAVDIAYAESSALISALDGSKYCAAWRVRRKRSNVGFANPGICCAYLAL